MLFDYQPVPGRNTRRIFRVNYRTILMSDGYSAWRTLNGPRMLNAWLMPGGTLSMPSSEEDTRSAAVTCLTIFYDLDRIETQASD